MRKKLLSGKMIGIPTILLVLFMAVGAARADKMDAGKQWTYVPEGGGAIITGHVEEPNGDLVIPSRLDGYAVTGIGDNAFSESMWLTGVSIPESVTSIGEAAFSWCDDLTVVSIPAGVTSICDRTFAACRGLTKVTIPKGVTGIGNEAFADCDSLADVSIPEGVTSIGDSAFARTGLTRITIPESVSHIGDMAFMYCDITSATIPASVTSIGANAFANSSEMSDDDDEDTLYGNDKLTLRVTEGSAGERYARESGIRFTYVEAQPQPDALADMVVLENRGIGGMSDVMQTPEGTLLTGTSIHMSCGWVVSLDQQGRERWSFTEENENYRYLHPTALPEAEFAVIRQQEDESLSMVVFDRNGQVTGDCPIPPYTQDMLAVGDSLFVLGNQLLPEEDSGHMTEGLPYLARFNSKTELLWFLAYPHSYAEQRFKKAVCAMDSLMIAADAAVDEPEAELGVLHRMDLDGRVQWTLEFTSDLGSECHIADVCVSEDGTIAVIVNDFGCDEDYGYAVNRLCTVFGLNMDGEVLWTHTLNDGEFRFSRIAKDGAMATRILPVPSGFLCAGYRIAREDSGLLNLEWLLLLDQAGNARAKDSTPDIKDDRIEVFGMAGSADGKALLYGANIEGLDALEEWEEGDTPGKPFYATLDFPEAYQP